jgi:hypothetical protein
MEIPDVSSQRIKWNRLVGWFGGELSGVWGDTGKTGGWVYT